jgi:hypothetical protein
MPIAKNRGRTVFGVRIGLELSVSAYVSQGEASMALTAMPSIAVDETQYLQ